MVRAILNRDSLGHMQAFLYYSEALPLAWEEVSAVAVVLVVDFGFVVGWDSCPHHLTINVYRGKE